MIQSLASAAQFITTTFRPGMLVTAGKFYGVSFNNQSSIKREEAMQLVDRTLIYNSWLCIWYSLPNFFLFRRRPKLSDLGQLIRFSSVFIVNCILCCTFSYDVRLLRFLLVLSTTYKIYLCIFVGLLVINLSPRNKSL